MLYILFALALTIQMNFLIIQIIAFLTLLIRAIRTFGSWTDAIAQKAIDELAVGEPQ